MGHRNVLFLFALLAACVLASCTVTEPIAATGIPLRTQTPLLEGSATAVRVLGVWVKGDASIAAAMRAGGIEQVCTVDQRRTSFLGLYERRVTVVIGHPWPNSGPLIVDPGTGR